MDAVYALTVESEIAHTMPGTIGLLLIGFLLLAMLLEGFASSPRTAVVPVKPQSPKY